MDDSLFSIFPPLFEKVVKWGSGSFEFYLPVRVISSWMPFDPGPFKRCYSVTSAERTFLMDWCAKRLDRGETLKPCKTSFPNRCSGIFLVESIEGWSKKQDKTSRQIRVDNRSEAYMSHRENHEASVTSYVYELRPKIRGPFDGC